MTRRRSLAVALAVAGALAAVPAAASALTVYGASSLRDALPALDGSPRYSFGGSNTLQLQIERGAPADLFLGASPVEATALYKEGLCTKPVTYATNVLTLIVPASNPAGITSVGDLRKGGLRLSVGAAGVPIGNYTRTMLGRLRLTSVLSINKVDLQPQVANIAARVSLNAADAGFVYVTDAKLAGSSVKQVKLPTWAQPPVRYEGCVVKRNGADSDGASAYLAKLTGTQGRTVLKKYGFGLPKQPKKK
jgi:molybdate transport system substrate-binding protein